MQVLGISTITNTLNPDTNQETSGDEVIEVGKAVGPRLLALVKAVLARI
jgi:purine nucleoside phosphorylase